MNFGAARCSWRSTRRLAPPTLSIAAARAVLDGTLNFSRCHQSSCQRGLSPRHGPNSVPFKGEPRDRWLTRKEAAALIWHCWRYREKQTIHAGASKGRPVQTDRRPLRHVAQLILIGLYTGTRAGAVASASPYAEQGRSYVDLERGIFYRKPIGKRATKKRATPAPVPPRLLAHLRRWTKRKLIATCFVEFSGKPVSSVKRGFASAVQLARLPAKSRLTPCVTRQPPGSCSGGCRSGRQLGSWACPQRSYRRPTATIIRIIFKGPQPLLAKKPGTFRWWKWVVDSGITTNQKEKPNDIWSEWQDSNLRPLRPERSDFFLNH